MWARGREYKTSGEVFKMMKLQIAKDARPQARTLLIATAEPQDRMERIENAFSAGSGRRTILQPDVGM